MWDSDLRVRKCQYPHHKNQRHKVGREVKLKMAEEIKAGGESSWWQGDCKPKRRPTGTVWSTSGSHWAHHIRNLQQTNRRSGWLSATCTDFWTRVIARTIPNPELVAVLKSEGGSPTSIYVSASTVPAYPWQSYDIKFISVTDHQLGKLMFR